MLFPSVTFGAKKGRVRTATAACLFVLGCDGLATQAEVAAAAATPAAAIAFTAGDAMRKCGKCKLAVVVAALALAALPGHSSHVSIH